MPRNSFKVIPGGLSEHQPGGAHNQQRSASGTQPKIYLLPHIYESNPYNLKTFLEHIEEKRGQLTITVEFPRTIRNRRLFKSLFAASHMGLSRVASQYHQQPDILRIILPFSLSGAPVHPIIPVAPSFLYDRLMSRVDYKRMLKSNTLLANIEHLVESFRYLDRLNGRQSEFMAQKIRQLSRRGTNPVVAITNPVNIPILLGSLRDLKVTSIDNPHVKDTNHEQDLLLNLRKSFRSGVDQEEHKAAAIYFLYSTANRVLNHNDFVSHYRDDALEVMRRSPHVNSLDDAEKLFKILHPLLKFRLQPKSFWE